MCAPRPIAIEGKLLEAMLPPIRRTPVCLLPNTRYEL